MNQKNRDIWAEDGELVPLMPHPTSTRSADVAAIIVNRNRGDLSDRLVGQVERMGADLDLDVYVVEMGSDVDKQSRYASIFYDDPDFRGKCYGHNVGLRLARTKAHYRYYWILMNDVEFDEGVDVLGELVRVADAESRLAVLSPAEPLGSYPCCKPQPGIGYRLVSTCDYLCFLIRSDVVDDVGFLNPDFKYSWGAIHELCYKIMRSDLHVAYCDTCSFRHLGGTTYGQTRGTVSREEYRKGAKEFARNYFVEHYGRSWDLEFSKALPVDVQYNTFKAHRDLWEDDGGVRNYPMPSGFVWKIKRLICKVLPFSRQASRFELERQVALLHPWYYPVVLNGFKVPPGIGSKQSKEELEARATYRSRLLVDEVINRYDVGGKRILDLAANCAYWSARLAEKGADSLFAVEGRYDSVLQAQLYWGCNGFLSQEKYIFLHGDVEKAEVWRKIEDSGPYDITLCCGLLYHTKDYASLLKRVASVTREVILIDTRVELLEVKQEEPGGWCFDAIVESREKVVPRKDNLLGTLDALGFDGHELSVDGPMPESLKGKDDYSTGARTVLLATKRS